jgi:hypothetical protein
MFPVRYGLNSYILFGRNSVFKGLTIHCETIVLVFQEESPDTSPSALKLGRTQANTADTKHDDTHSPGGIQILSTIHRAYVTLKRSLLPQTCSLFLLLITLFLWRSSHCTVRSRVAQSVERWATGRTAEIRFLAEARNISPLHSFPDCLWSPPSLKSNGSRRHFPLGKSGWGVKLTTQLHLVPS